MRSIRSRRPLLPHGVECLVPFVEIGILAEADVQVAGVLYATMSDLSDEVLLAGALCVRALQLGHVCVEVGSVAGTVGLDMTIDGEASTTAIEDLPWPEPARWADALRSSPAVAVCDPAIADARSAVDGDTIRPLVFDGTRIYLERYWRYERKVGEALLGRAEELNDTRDTGSDNLTLDTLHDASVDAVLDRYLGVDANGNNLQRRGAAVALARRVTVLAGGPGTGKTHTVARLLAVMHQLALDADRRLEVALAAPTGKAAARMTQAVHRAVGDADLPAAVAEPMLSTKASTIHRLLGHRDGISFRHDQTNPLPHDVVVVDETSMIALPLMARLLDALRPDTRLVLVGDPFQLASVEAGTVLGDVVGEAARNDEPSSGPLADSIVVLRHAHRFAADSAIAALAEAVRVADAQQVLSILRDPGATGVTWIDPSDVDSMQDLRQAVSENATALVHAASAGHPEAALRLATEMKLLCATRHGPLGALVWGDTLERRLPQLVRGLNTADTWYVGRPVIVTRNDYITGVYNGDTGLVVRQGDRTVVAMSGADGVRTLVPPQLDAVETWWAMTIHKSQGSEFTHAVVMLPQRSSRLLTNELLYTGITRAREQVTLVADEDALRTAITRRVARASGLGARIWP